MPPNYRLQPNYAARPSDEKGVAAVIQGAPSPGGPLYPGPPPGTPAAAASGAPMPVGGYVGASADSAAAARQKRLAQADKTVAPGAPAASPAAAVETPSAEVSRGTGASMARADARPDASTFGAEDWRGGMAKQAPTFTNFESSGAARPSDFVSFNEFASMLDEPMRERAASAAGAAQAGGERARQAFSSALGSATAQGVDVENTGSYADFQREQSGAESTIGAELTKLGTSADPYEEALRSVYRKQLQGVSSGLAGQRTAAEMRAAQRDAENQGAAAQRPKAETPASAATTPTPATSTPAPPKGQQAIPVEQPPTPEEFQAAWDELWPQRQDFDDAYGPEAAADEFEKAVVRRVNQTRAGRRTQDQVSRTTPGLL